MIVAWRGTDNEIGVKWPVDKIGSDLILSPKDQIRPRLSELSAQQLPSFEKLK